MSDPIIVHTYYPARRWRRGADSVFERWYKDGRTTKDADMKDADPLIEAARKYVAGVPVGWRNYATHYFAEGALGRSYTDPGHQANATATAAFNKMAQGAFAAGKNFRQSTNYKGRTEDGPLSAWLHAHGLAFASPDKGRDAGVSLSKETLLAMQNKINERVSSASAALKAVIGTKSGHMGLTPPAVKESVAYKSAMSEYTAAFNELRNFNGKFAKALR